MLLCQIDRMPGGVMAKQKRIPPAPHEPIPELDEFLRNLRVMFQRVAAVWSLIGRATAAEAARALE
jgi:hypothetical protein